MAITNYPIKFDKGLDTLTESGQAQSGTLSKAECCVPRPIGAVSRPPTYSRLWNTVPANGNANTLGDPREAAYVTLGSSLALTNSTGTFIVRVRNSQYAFLQFAKPTQASNGTGMIALDSRGFFYVGTFGADGQLPTNPSATYELLRQGLATDRNWDGIRIGPYILMGNGVDANLLYNTSNGTLETAGTNERPPAPTITTGTGTLAAMWRNVVITYCTPGVFETGPSPVSNTVAYTGGTFTVNVAASPVPANYSHIRIYVGYYNAFHQTGELEYKFAAEVANATAAIQVREDWVRDRERSVDVSKRTESEIIPPCSMFAWHDNEVYCSGNVATPNKIWVTKKLESSLAKPVSWNKQSIQVFGDVTRGRDDQITALHAYQGNLIAHTKNSLNRVVARRSSTFVTYEVYPINAIAGAINQRALAVLPNGNTIFLGRDLNLYRVEHIMSNAQSIDNLKSVGSITSAVSQASLKFSDYPLLISDGINNLVWICVNQSTSNLQITADLPRMFCFDPLTESLWGPYSKPNIHRGTYIDPIDGLFYFSTPTAELGIWSLNRSDYREPEKTPSNSALTLAETTSSLILTPIGDAPDVIDYWFSQSIVRPNPGFFGVFTVISSEIPFAMVLETQWMDFGYSNRKKSVAYVDLHFHPGIAPTIYLEVYADSLTRKISRWFGQKTIGTNGSIRIPIAINGTRFKVHLRLGTAHNNTVRLYGMSAGYILQGEIV
jgi:hypothetical protein